MSTVASENEETRDAWNGPLFDRFLQFRPLIVSSLGRHGDQALRLFPPAPADDVLDIGCGFGDTTLQIARLVGEEGSVHGVDVAEKFISLAGEELDKTGLKSVSYETMDVQTAEFDERFDLAFSRFGTMFFANPVVALRNVRQSLRPGGRLMMVVWRQKPDNMWLHRAEVVVKDFLEKPEDSDEPTCGPGPFSMAGADTTSQILVEAGFEAISLRRCDIDANIGDMDSAIQLLMAVGPGGEVIRLSGDNAEEIRPRIESALRAGLEEYETPDGVIAGSSTWIVQAVNPG